MKPAHRLNRSCGFFVYRPPGIEVKKFVNNFKVNLIFARDRTLHVEKYTPVFYALPSRSAPAFSTMNFEKFSGNGTQTLIKGMKIKN